MFVLYSCIKNFHCKRFYFKRSVFSRISYHKYRTGTPKTQKTEIKPIEIHKYAAATLVKNRRYSQLFKKSKFKEFDILRRSLSTGSVSCNQNQDQRNAKKPEDLGTKLFQFLLPFFYFIVAVYILNMKQKKDNSISWEEFKHEFLAKGEVKGLFVSVLSNTVEVEVHDGAVIKNRDPKVRYFLLKVPDIQKFEDKLREAEEELGIPPKDRVLVSYGANQDLGQSSNLIISALLFLAIIGFTFFKVKDPKIMQFMSKSKYTLIDPLMSDSSKGVKFSDVAGLKEAKTEIMDFVDYLKRPEVYRNLGAKVPKGALLLGPPGCGKTLLAKAVATEANVPFLSMNGSEFIEIIGGLGAARVRELFKDAKKRIPCIIYIDEIDAIGKKRESLDNGGGEAEQTLNQLLVEMDGLVSSEGIVLLASTNRAHVLDKALLRPGRFDRHILIDLPTYQERLEIFEHHLKSIHLEHEPKVYSKRMAHLTPGFSGADIANVCNEAALHAARVQKQIVQADDLEYAVDRVVGGTEKRSSSRTPEEKKMFAYYEAGRALVGWLSKYGEALLKITIVARTDSPAGWTHFSPNDKHLYSTDDLRGKMCMGLGGRVAIQLLFNCVTTAGEKDLKKVTNLAYAQVRRFGMNENIGLMSFDISGNENSLKKPYSKVLGNMFDLEARKLVAETYKETEKLILENKAKLIQLAEELLVKETLNYDDVVKLIGPPAFDGKTLVEPLEFIHSLDQAVAPQPNAEESNQ